MLGLFRDLLVKTLLIKWKEGFDRGEAFLSRGPKQLFPQILKPLPQHVINLLFPG